MLCCSLTKKAAPHGRNSSTHLDDVSILDHRPEQLAILRLILLLLQVSSMLESRKKRVRNKPEMMLALAKLYTNCI